MGKYTLTGSQTVQQFADSLTDGDIGLIPPGEYSIGDLFIHKPNIKLRPSQADKTALLKGSIRFQPQAVNAQLIGFKLDGRNVGNEPGPLVFADGVTIARNEITNYNTTIGVHLQKYYDHPGPVGVKVLRNHIHHCGQLPATNYEHGIYLGDCRNTLIQNNLIEHCADRGVQLYSNADYTKIISNTILYCGEGLIFGGNEQGTSDNNVVRDNIIAFSTLRFNVEDSWPTNGPYGKNNIVRDNLLWTDLEGYYGGHIPHSGVRLGPGFSYRDNVIGNPNNPYVAQGYGAIIDSL